MFVFFERSVERHNGTLYSREKCTFARSGFPLEYWGQFHPGRSFLFTTIVFPFLISLEWFCWFLHLIPSLTFLSCFVSLSDHTFIFQTAEHIFLREMGSPNRIPCTAVTYFLPCNKTQIAEEIKNDARDPILLIRGGGNYGDLYYVHRKFVNEYVSSFKNVPILLLPQSVYYQNTSHARRDAQIRNHSNFVLLARDKVSLNFMKTFFPNQDSYLSPDFAQYIGPVDRSQCKQTVDILFLARISKDVEKVAELGNVYEVSSQLQKRNLTSQVMDWFDYPRILTRRKWKPPTNLMEFPEFRTKVGIWMLCQGRVIVTDRLHATIMSTLLGLPYVYLDNTYKKIQNYRESWLSPNPDCSDENLRARKASTWQTAAEMAVELYQNEYSS